MKTKTKDSDGYLAILEVSKKTGYPSRFKNDLLKIDREFLQSYQGSFGWVLRESGTHLLRTESKETQDYCDGYGREKIIFSKIFDDCLSFYFWSGKNKRLIRMKDEETMRKKLKFEIKGKK